MFIERLILANFRCFGPEATTIELTPGLTTFVGVNGAGKTAVMQALQRLFGITGDHRRLRRQDFHVPAAELVAPLQRTFIIEAILAFPELDADGADAGAIPEFFQQMAADEAGRLKCRLRLEATWTDDGSLEGTIEQKYRAVRALGPFVEADCIELKALDRARIQMIYVPASRDGASQVTAFLRGRLWRAINWSQGVRDTFSDAGATLNGAFSGEAAVDIVATAVRQRWQEVHTAGTDTTPLFRPVDLRFQEFIRKVEVVFRPDEAGRERALDDLSDGQRSLFHLAMTAATLDVEGRIAADPVAAGFQPGGVPLPALTLIAIEEPENNLAPFYLSRIVRQIDDLTKGNRAQAVVSSHSASILARVDPSQVRHFRLNPADRTARVRSIRLPVGLEDASKFVREAVRTYPELYFARFAVLGEGASEEVVLPRLAEAMGFDVDRSFVAVVPLGGRHVNHLWRLRAITSGDDVAEARAEADLTAFLTMLRADMANTEPSPASAAIFTASILAFLDLGAVARTYLEYASGDLLAIMVDAFQKHLAASADGAATWTICLDAFEGLEQIPLMTVHKSKGLEYDTIVFIGLDDQAWWAHTPGNPEGLATFFVALSRAKQRAIFAFCQERGQRRRVAELFQLLTDAGVPEIAI